MGRYIIKLGNYYLEWSSIVDAPVGFGMTLDEFTAHYREHYGTDSMDDLARRLERVERTGTSAHNYVLADIITANRAGPKECSLRQQEIYEAYCLRQPIRDGWTVP